MTAAPCAPRVAARRSCDPLVAHPLRPSRRPRPAFCVWPPWPPGGRAQVRAGQLMRGGALWAERVVRCSRGYAIAGKGRGGGGSGGKGTRARARTLLSASLASLRLRSSSARSSRCRRRAAAAASSRRRSSASSNDAMKLSPSAASTSSAERPIATASPSALRARTGARARQPFPPPSRRPHSASEAAPGRRPGTRARYQLQYELSRSRAGRAVPQKSHVSDGRLAPAQRTGLAWWRSRPRISSTPASARRLRGLAGWPSTKKKIARPSRHRRRW